jgi:hypothetical protein
MTNKSLQRPARADAEHNSSNVGPRLARPVPHIGTPLSRTRGSQPFLVPPQGV